MVERRLIERDLEQAFKGFEKHQVKEMQEWKKQVEGRLPI